MFYFCHKNTVTKTCSKLEMSILFIIIIHLFITLLLRLIYHGSWEKSTYILFLTAFIDLNFLIHMRNKDAYCMPTIFTGTHYDLHCQGPSHTDPHLRFRSPILCLFHSYDLWALVSFVPQADAATLKKHCP